MSKKKTVKDGGPAYPFRDEEGGFGQITGMSMRQAYKMAVVEGLLARENHFGYDIVGHAGRIADLLIEEDEEAAK
jgi:hypothetical protein